MFKKRYSFNKRTNEALKVMDKYPNRAPIIVEKSRHATDIPNIDRKKYLVPKDITVAEFIYIIRKRLHDINPNAFTADKALYFFVNNSSIPVPSQTINMLYENHKDEDNFLYMTYAGESTFG